MGESPSDRSPLTSAAALGKLRLVRLLLEGGAQVNERNPRGETPFLAACKALRGEPTGPETLKLLAYLLQNQADPNAQDRAGRTPLMYACMERAGPRVAAALLSAGADPSMEDYSGASALVYAINAQHQPTLQVLLDACRAKGRDIIIITTDLGVSGGPVTRRYLNVPPSPDSSPAAAGCMSPSDIVLKTGSPSSPESHNVFSFRGTGRKGSISVNPPSEPSPVGQSSSSTPPPRQRMWSEPWLAIHNLARLTQAYEDVRRGGGALGEGEGEGGGALGEGGRAGGGENAEGEQEEEERMTCLQSREDGRRSFVHGRQTDRPGPGASRPLPQPSSPELRSDPRRPTPKTAPAGWGGADELPPCRPPPSPPHWQSRRNTLPSLTVAPPPLLHLPPLLHHQSGSDSHLQVPPPAVGSVGAARPPRPPSSSSSPSPRSPRRASCLPPLPPSSSDERGRSSRRLSVQLERRGGGERDQLTLPGL